MTRREFFHSTIKEVNIKIRSYWDEEKRKQDFLEYHAWVSGAYVMNAIGACISKKHQYPSSPFFSKKEESDKIAENSGKTKEEIQQNLRLMELMVRKANANIEKKRKEIQGK